MFKRTAQILLSAACLALALWFATTSVASAHDGVGGDEYAAADIMLIVAMMSFLMAGLAIIWSVRNGEFRNPEDIKRRMLDLALTDEDGDDLEKYVTTEPYS